jgi:hypothetical protein
MLGAHRTTIYFYDNPAEMISGEIPAPLLALGNRDVILRHANAIVFGATTPGLAGRMINYVSVMGKSMRRQSMSLSKLSGFSLNMGSTQSGMPSAIQF